MKAVEDAQSASTVTKTNRTPKANVASVAVVVCGVLELLRDAVASPEVPWNDADLLRIDHLLANARELVRRTQ